jgi:translation initiation factor 2B subunit (eIF-2B alpha/beta/delta family)
MPRDNQIPQLLERLSGPLSQDKLESLSKEFQSLTQDRAETLTFFVLENVCRTLARTLEGEAVSVQRFHDLTNGIAEEIKDVLRAVQNATQDVEKLQSLVGLLFRNLALYRK